MANHAFLMANEEKLIDARTAVRDLIQAVQAETKANTGKVAACPAEVRIHRDNRDLWGTVITHAHVLRRQLGELAELLQPEFS